MREILVTFVAVLLIAVLSSCRHYSRQEVKKETTPQPQATSRFPSPTGLVNDYANVLDVESRSRIETLLSKLKANAKIEFAVVTMETTKGEPIDDYSLALVKEWGVGPKDSNEGGGMLFLIAMKDRQWRLQVSRSLEKDLPDDVCKKLGDNSLPLYKNGNYAGGIEKYVVALIDRLKQLRGFSLD
jgi:uncharacterized protein